MSTFSALTFASCLFFLKGEEEENEDISAMLHFHSYICSGICYSNRQYKFGLDQ